MKHQLKLAFYFSLVYLLMFNSGMFILEFEKVKSVIFAATLETIKNIVYIFLGLFVTFLGLLVHRVIFYVSSFFLFLIGSLSSYYNLLLGIKITPEIITVIFRNDINDAIEMMSYKPVIWALFSILIWFIMIKIYSKTINEIKGLRAIPLLIVFAISIISLFNPGYKIFKIYLPWQTTHSFYSFINKNPESQIFDISSETATLVDKTSNDKIVMLVIGESARYDHLGINGYKEDTTPFWKNNKNMLSFYAHSCASLTYISVSCMLSRHNRVDFVLDKNETSIISVFNKVGFTTSWIGTQTIHKYFYDKVGGSFYSEAKNLIIPGGSALFKINDYDEAMLPFIKDFINKEGNKFIVVHTSGSHWDYSNRYPKNFEKFKPICPHNKWGKKDPTDCSKEELEAMYNNSIRYTDYFLNQVYTELQDKNAFVIYTSDHGESLGEDGVYGHGGSKKEQFEVPFIFWGSDKFWNNHKEMKEYLSEQKNMNLSHDNIFHSLLDCAGISSKLIDPTLSLCSFGGL